MKLTFPVVHAAIVVASALSLCSSVSNAQLSQVNLYLNDGHGNLTQVSAPNGTGTLQLPGGSGTLLTTTTGLANPMSVLGDMIYGGASGVATQLPGNTSGSTKKFLTSTASSGVATAPAWGTIAGSDVPVFVASGSSHASGAVPDPGSSSGTTRLLREDATWVAPSGGSSAMMISGFSSFSGGGGYYTYPVGFTGNSTTSTADVADGDVMVVNRSGTLKNFTVSIGSVPNSGSYTFTIYKGFTSTGLTLTFNNSSLATQTDSTHTYNISNGNLLSIKYVGSGGPPTTNAAWAFDIQ